MSYFKYTGFNLDRKEVSDVIEAASREEAVERLQERNILVTTISESTRRVRARAKGKVSARDIVVFTRLLSTMVNANVPIIDGLEISIEQVPPGRLQEIVHRLIADIKSGLSLSEALAMHPDVFSKLYCAMVKAGELSGKLGIILEQLFSFMERMDNLKRKVVSALIYPSVIMALALLIVGLFLLVFIPQFKKNFTEFGDKLPGITRFFISLSDWVNAYFIYFFVAAVIALIVAMRLLKTPRGIVFKDRFVLQVPLAGPLVKKVTLVRVTRTLGTLLGNGVPIIEALDIVAAASGNAVMENLLQLTKRRISDGERMARTLAGSILIPKMVLQMIAMGEETGHLPEMLDKIAHFYDSDVDVAVERLNSALTPILIIGLGIFVALVVIALFLPIFNMSQLT